MLHTIPNLSRTDLSAFSEYNKINAFENIQNYAWYVLNSDDHPARNSELIHRLVSTNVIRKNDVLRRYPSVKAVQRELDCVPSGRVYDDFDAKLVQRLKESAGRSQAREYQRRLAAELREAERNSWYVVFNTLTYDQEHLYNARLTYQSHVSSYVRAVGESVIRSVHGALTYLDDDGTHKKYKLNDYHRYFVVPELWIVTGKHVIDK